MNVPKLRFKEFSGEWEEKYLGEVVCSLDYGMGASACEYDGVNKYIRITDIDDVTHKYLDTDIVSPNGELCDKYVVRPNDILFARTGASTGKTYLYDEKDGLMYFAGFLIRANVKTEFDANFIYGQTLLNRYKKWVGIESMRSGQPGINAEQYSKFTVNVPVYEEQKKISSMLGLVDDKISNCYKIITSLEIQKKGLMQKIFSQKLRFKDDKGEEFPDWEENSDEIKIVSGNAYPLLSYSIEGTLLIQGLNIYPGGLMFDNIIRIGSDYQGEKHVVVYKNDILLGLNRPIVNDEVKVCLVDVDEKAFLYQRAGVLKFNVQKIHYAFLYQYLRSDEFKRRLSNELVGSDQPYIKSDLFDVIKPPMPCYKEQEKIAMFFTKFDEKIMIERMSLEHWQQVKKGLLQQMFV